jgi:hypothetical protein
VRRGHRPKLLSTPAGDVEVAIPKLRTVSLSPRLLPAEPAVEASPPALALPPPPDWEAWALEREHQLAPSGGPSVSSPRRPSPARRRPDRVTTTTGADGFSDVAARTG